MFNNTDTAKVKAEVAATNLQWDDEVARKLFLELTSRSLFVKGIPVGLTVKYIKKSLANHFGVKNCFSIYVWEADPIYPTTQAILTFNEVFSFQRATYSLESNQTVSFGSDIFSVLKYTAAKQPTLRHFVDDLCDNLRAKAMEKSGKLTGQVSPPTRSITSKQSPYSLRPDEGVADKASTRKLQTLAEIWNTKLDKRLKTIDHLLIERSKNWTPIGLDSNWGYFQPNFKLALQNRDKYLEEIVGDGAEATVFFGKQLKEQQNPLLPNFVAVKRFDITKLTYEPSDAQTIKILKEKGGNATAAEYFDYKEASEDSSQAFLIMELCPCDLHHLIVSSDIPANLHQPSDIKAVILQLCQGVELLHSCQIVHRDIRPSNFLLTKSGIIKLTDFGFARDISVHPQQTLYSVRAGQNLQPYEVVAAHNQRPVRKSVDIFMLGMTMYFVASGGRYPFGEKGLQEEQAQAIHSQGKPKLEVINNVALQWLLKNMLSHNHQQRFSIADVIGHPYFWSFADKFNKIEQLKSQLASGPLRACNDIVSDYVGLFQFWKKESIPSVMKCIRTSEGLSDCEAIVHWIRNGLAHSATWDYVIHHDMIEACKRYNIESVNEYFFSHPSVAWFLPAFYEKACKVRNEGSLHEMLLSTEDEGSQANVS